MLDVIESGAKNQNIQIIKSVKDFDNKKEFFVFNSKRNNSDFIRNKTSLLTPSDLLNREIKGKYYIIGEHFNVEELTSELKKAGLTSEVEYINSCLLYTSDAADDLTRVDLGGRRIIKKPLKHVPL
ncbi:hypothetical protein JMUB7535_26570 [Staphylococcus aureus]